MSTTTIPRLPGRTTRPAAGGRLRSVVRGRTGDPAWVRPALLALFGLAALLCLWNLTENGYSNEYYAAAAKAGSESWKAWFFGALDPGSFITVDKPPLSLWLSGLSARVLGFSSFSILLPQALCTVAAVGVLYTTVRRLFGAPAGLIAGLALALTPVTVAIGRVNNPDALLVLLMVSAAWFTVRAVQTGRTRHLAWAGAFVGLAFMTKLLQGWMVVPALALVYLIAGPPRLLARVRQLLVAGVTMVVVSAAWPVAVTLWPGSKPYIGGSTNGSIWNLIFGYDGFGRIFGSSGGSTQGGISFGGAAGLLRMFNTEVGGQVAWLIPVAAVGLIAGLWLTRGERRTDLRRAGLILFGVWALVHVAVFSSQKGIFHPYYVSALAPAIAALVGAGAVLVAGWARRSWAGIVAAAVAIAAGAWMAEVLLDRDPSFVALAAGGDRGRRGGLDHPAGAVAGRPRRAPCGARPRAADRGCGDRRDRGAGRAGVLRGGHPVALDQRQQRDGRAGLGHLDGRLRRRLGRSRRVGRSRPLRRSRRLEYGSRRWHRGPAERIGDRVTHRRPAVGRFPGRGAAHRRGRGDGRRHAVHGHDPLPRAAPGLGQVPAGRDRIADHGADHHPDRPSGGDHRRLQRR